MSGVASSSAGLSPTIKDSLEKTKDALQEGQKLISQRQKLIKIADRSEHGWKFVKEYESDDLAEDDDDEKRIAKAEKAADKKAAATKKKKVVSRLSQSRPLRSQWYGQSIVYGPRPYGSGAVPAQPTRLRPPQYMHGSLGLRPQMSRPLGPCFRCGEMGHLQSSCPKTTPQYPFHISNVQGCGEHPSNYCSVSNVPISMSHETDTDMVSSRYWESEDVMHVGSVKGRLRKKIAYWRDVLKAPQVVLDIIEHGYRLLLVSVPASYNAPNHNTAVLNCGFVDEAIADLLAKGCVREVLKPPHICSPLLVVENSSGKRRLVINLRYLNLFLWKDKFKYEDIRTALDYFEVGDFLFTFDLKSGYHHIDIHENFQSFLGFTWNQKKFVFTVLPFGLATACYIFTKVLRPIVKHIRSKGHRFVLYLDDGLVVTHSPLQEAISCSDEIKGILLKAGLVLNEDKSRMAPSVSGSWLGFFINLQQGIISIPKVKIDALKDTLRVVVGKDHLQARELASIIGKIVSMGIGIGSIARVLCIHCCKEDCHGMTGYIWIGMQEMNYRSGYLA